MLTRASETARVREITTPEGISLPFEVASIGDRLAAFFIDFLLIHVAVFVILLLGVWSAGAREGIAVSIALLSSFLIRNCYFIVLELRWGGATIGKRRLGLRVVSGDGGALRAEAVFARNLTRDFEVFLPLTALSNPEALLPGLPGWAAFIGVLWAVLFALVPLLNRDHLRVGDMVAGTLVVRMPRTRLLEDLAEYHAGAFAGTARTATVSERFSFTAEQLDLYGIQELQVLEELLRKSEGRRDLEVLEAVAERIKKKIDWRDDPGEPTWEFLSAFYKAQRARLEHKMLFGVRQEKKIP